MARMKSEPEISRIDEVFTANESYPAMQSPVVEEQTDDRLIENVLADLGGDSDAKVNVYLLEPGKGSAFVGSFEPSNFSIEEIQRTYGAGEYKIHVRRDGRLVANRTIKIAAPKISALVAPAPIHDKAEIGKLAETMNNGFQQLGQMLAQSIQAVLANQPKAKTSEEMLREMMLMKELISPVQSQQSGNQIELFLQGIEFAKSITPREGEPGANEIILEAIKNFGGMFSQMKPSAPAGVQRSAASPAVPGLVPPAPSGINVSTAPNIGNTSPEIGAPQALATTQSTEPDNMSLLKSVYLNTLLANAKADSDPMTYANMALDLLGENKVLEIVNRPDWFALLCAELPEAANYREWFDEMRSNILVLTNPDERAMNSDNPTNPDANAIHKPTIDGQADIKPAS